MHESDSQLDQRIPAELDGSLSPSSAPENADAGRGPDFAEALVAYDEALSRGSSDSTAGSSVESRAGDPLDEAKECLRLLERVWPRSGTDSTSDDGSASLDRNSSESKGDRSENALPRGHGLGSVRRLGRFRIRRELGRGGGGIVYLAVDEKLGRKVALKVPRPEFVFTDEMRERFLFEARAAAALNHPNIVPVYEAGEAGPVCYIASAFCRGPTLAAWLSQLGRPLSGWAAAQLMAALADAVEHAHRQGVLHRDLKPGNVLLVRAERDSETSPDLPGTRGSKQRFNFVPKLTDFGLAKSLVQEGRTTVSRAVLGTPEYMAPEQAEGRHEDIGPQTDVYALGVILYELLTGQTPFRGSGDLQTLYKIATAPPERPRKIQPRLDRDLEAICLKCLEKETARRYASAAELAADLRRYLSGRLVSARPACLLRRAADWAKRRPTLASVLAVTVLSATLFTCAASWNEFRVRRVEETSARLQESTRQFRQRLVRYDYARFIQGAYQAWQNIDVRAALELLDRCRPRPGEEDLRGFEWYYVHRLCSGTLGTLHGSQGQIFDVAFSPDGDLLASAGEDGTVELWDHAAVRQAGKFVAHEGGVRALAYSPDGRRLITAGDDGLVKVWDTRTHQLMSTRSGHTGPVLCLAISSDGALLASGGKDRTVKVWDMAGSSLRLDLRGHTDSVRAVGFSPDGKTLASGGLDSTIRLWDLNSPETPVRVRVAPNEVVDLAFSPDGRMLATACGSPHLWDLSTDAAPVMLHGHRNFVKSVAFSPDGETLATTGFDMTVVTWNVRTHQPIHEFHAHTRPIHCLAYSPAGDLLASASKEGTIHLWDPASAQDHTAVPLSGERRYVRVDFSNDPNLLAIASSRSSPKIHELEVFLWDCSRETVSRRLERILPFRLTCMTLSPGGDCIALASSRFPLLLWDASTRNEVKTLDDQTYINCGFSADGTRLAVAGYLPDGVRVIDVERRTVVARPPGILAAGFSPDGRLIAMQIAEPDFSIGLWDCAREQIVSVMSGHNGEIISIAFSADGRLLASGSVDGTARLWDIGTGRIVHTLRAHTGAVRQVAFDPAGHGLATASDDGTVRLWDTDTGQTMLTINIVRHGVNSLSFSSDGQILATGCDPYPENSRVDLWYAPRGEPARSRGN